jgi:5-formyltetrahydrofolate cyclo-ligase
VKKSPKHSKTISDNLDVDVKLQKTRLRKTLLNIRNNTSDRGNKSDLIVRKILQLQEITSAKEILLYYPTKNEVDISGLFQIFHKLGKSIYLPKVTDFHIAKFTPETSLIKGYKGILEPEGLVENPEQIDICIIPGLGFDYLGNRIGHGGGWYDRIFKIINFTEIIGVCFDSQVVTKIPTESHDKEVDIVITEKKIINTRY